MYGPSHCHEVCSKVIIYFFSSSSLIGREVRKRGAFIKTIPNHGKHWKIIGVIIFIVELVPTHLLLVTVVVNNKHGRASHLARE